MQKSKNDLTARELLAFHIKRLRKDQGISQEELALKAGFHRTFVAHVERLARNTSLDNIEKLAFGLQVPVGELLSPHQAMGRVAKRHSARELLALNLLRLRTAKGLSQDVAAAEAGVDRTFFTQVERQGRNISLDNLEKLAIALQVPVGELLAPP